MQASTVALFLRLLSSLRTSERYIFEDFECESYVASYKKLQLNNFNHDLRLKNKIKYDLKYSFLLRKMIKKRKKNKKVTAYAENRTRINCLEGNYADHYTTNARYQFSILYSKFIHCSFLLIFSINLLSINIKK